MNDCPICGQDDPHEMSACTYCGKFMCYDCLGDHEDECEDSGE